MKPFYPVLLALLFLQCKKTHVEEDLNYVLTYEVITTSGTWFGEYTDSALRRVATSQALPSGWRYTFKLKYRPFEMFMSATTTCLCPNSPTSPDVIINFYSNGSLFKSDTNTWARGVSSLTFELR